MRFIFLGDDDKGGHIEMYGYTFDDMKPTDIEDEFVCGKLKANRYFKTVKGRPPKEIK